MLTQQKILELHNCFSPTNAPEEKNMLQRQIEATDAEINRVVYKVYGLTDDEIRVVEGS